MSLISRQDAIDALCKRCDLVHDVPCTEKCNDIKILEKLPSATRPTGRWILDPNGPDWNLPAWKCSECGCKNNNIGVVDKGFAKNPLVWAGSKFCPNCGARMEDAK